MNSGNTFDDDKTVFIYPQSNLKEDNLLFFQEDDPDNKLPLVSGEAVMVGRSIESDFFIENKTVSRRHLTIRREDRQVTIEIHGRNGLYLDDQLNTEPQITVSPPVSFTIGDVVCRLEFEIDQDRTIIVTAKPPGEMPPSPGSAHSFSSDRPNPRHPFDPSPNDRFIPPDPPSPDKKWRDEISPQPLDRPPSDHPSFDPLPDKSMTGSGPARFEPVPTDKQSLFNPEQGKANWLATHKNNLIIAVLFIIIVILFFIIFIGPPDKQNRATDLLPTPPGESPVSTSSGTLPEHSHQAFLDLANELIKSGDIVTARDVLKDIPEDSPDYTRAQKILEKLPEN